LYTSFEEERWTDRCFALLVLALGIVAIGVILLLDHMTGLLPVSPYEVIETVQTVAEFLFILGVARLTVLAGQLAQSETLRKTAAHVTRVTWGLVALFGAMMLVVLFALRTERLALELMLMPLAYLSMGYALYWGVRYLLMLFVAYRQLQGAALRDEQRLLRAAQHVGDVSES
jgi:hypothetical protein